MDMHELIAAVKAAATKNDLEALVKRELDIDVDKRKSLETLRADVLKGLGAEGEKEPSLEGAVTLDAEPEPSAPVSAAQDVADRSEGVASLSEPGNAAPLPTISEAVIDEPLAESDTSGEVMPSLTPPPFEDEEEAPTLPERPALRLLRNTENGREFAWSPELAVLPYMREV